CARGRYYSNLGDYW
nr:immunoglobulin heavy chain junction region [Mus musculus]